MILPKLQLNDKFSYKKHSNNQWLAWSNIYKKSYIICENEFQHLKSGNLDLIDKENIQNYIKNNILCQSQKTLPIIIQDDNNIDYLSFEITGQCNFRCLHCYVSPNYSINTLDTEQIKEIINKSRDNGCIFMHLTGGEPLLHKDFMDLYQYAYSQNLFIKLSTNGSLINEDHIELFKSYPPYKIAISLYGNNNNVYSIITGSKSYNKVIKNLDKLSIHNINHRVNIIVMKQNFHQIKTIKEYFAKTTTDYQFYCLINPTFQNEDRSILQINPKYFKEIIKTNYPIQDICTQSKTCNAGLKSFHIDPLGKVNLCKIKRDPYYSIFEYNFIELKKIFNKTRLTVFQKPAECDNCNIQSSCNICPLQYQQQLNSKILCIYAKLKKEVN